MQVRTTAPQECDRHFTCFITRPDALWHVEAINLGTPFHIDPDKSALVVLTGVRHRPCTYGPRCCTTLEPPIGRAVPANPEKWAFVV
jgi:hypothetical protein